MHIRSTATTRLFIFVQTASRGDASLRSVGHALPSIHLRPSPQCKLVFVNLDQVGRQARLLRGNWHRKKDRQRVFVFKSSIGTDDKKKVRDCETWQEVYTPVSTYGDLAVAGSAP